MRFTNCSSNQADLIAKDELGEIQARKRHRAKKDGPQH